MIVITVFGFSSMQWRVFRDKALERQNPYYTNMGRHSIVVKIFAIYFSMFGAHIFER